MPGKRIGILTGGGDVPGLNAVIKNVVYRSENDNHHVIGIRRGWEGLTNLNLDDPKSKGDIFSRWTRRTLEQSTVRAAPFSIPPAPILRE